MSPEQTARPRVCVVELDRSRWTFDVQYTVMHQPAAHQPYVRQQQSA